MAELEVPARVASLGAQTRRAMLREANAPLHQQLDARFTPTDFLERDRYARFLERTARALVPLEQTLRRSVVPDLFADWDARQRSAALLQDLDELGVAFDEASLAGPLENVTLRPAQALGALYVLEGSRLGSRVLLGHTRASDDPVVRAATRYLSANDPSLWRSFLTTLESATLESARLEGAETFVSQRGLIEGARFAFERYLTAYASID